MDNIDKKILKNLNESDRKLLEEQSGLTGLMSEISDSFKGKHQQLVIYVWVVGSVIFGLILYSGYQYFSVDSISDKLTWATIFLMSFIGSGLIKMWYWMELNRASTSRDIKRMELQLSLLIQSLGSEKK